MSRTELGAAYLNVSDLSCETPTVRKKSGGPERNARHAQAKSAHHARTLNTKQLGGDRRRLLRIFVATSAGSKQLSPPLPASGQVCMRG
jgi:hypothetical protein